MNNFSCTGRFGQEPELKTSSAGKSYMNFSLAVRKDNSKDSDFLNFVAFGKTAEFICNWFHKGSQILIAKSTAQVNAFTDKNGTNRRDVQFIVNKVEFFGDMQETQNKPTVEQRANEMNANTDADFEEIGNDDDDLPW